MRHLQPNSLPPGLEKAQQKANLDRARGIWYVAGLTNYRFDLTVDLFYGPDELKGPFAVHVQSGKVVQVKEKLTGQAAGLEILLNTPTLDGLLDRIESDLDDENLDNLSVTYHPSQGFPEKYFVAKAVILDGVKEGYDVSVTFIKNVVPM